MPPAFALSQDQTLKFIPSSTLRHQTNKRANPPNSITTIQTQLAPGIDQLLSAILNLLRIHQQHMLASSNQPKPINLQHHSPNHQSSKRSNKRRQRIPSIQIQLSKNRASTSSPGSEARQVSVGRRVLEPQSQHVKQPEETFQQAAGWGNTAISCSYPRLARLSPKNM